MKTNHYTPLFATIRHSTKLASLPNDTCRLFYLLLLAQVDAWGRIDARPAVLFAEVWPLLGKSTEDTWRCRDALVDAGLIEIRMSDRETWIQLPDWEEKAGKIGRKDHRHVSAFPAEGAVLPSPSASVRVRPDPSGRDQTGPDPSGNGSSSIVSSSRARSPQPQPQPQSSVPSEPPPPQASAGSSSETSKAKKKSGEDHRRGDHVQVIETFQRAWAQFRHGDELEALGVAINASTPPTDIPAACRYLPDAPDFIAAARLWKQVGGDMALIKARMRNYFESTATFLQTARFTVFCKHFSNLHQPMLQIGENT